jgi:hypothetical protein
MIIWSLEVTQRKKQGQCAEKQKGKAASWNSQGVVAFVSSTPVLTGARPHSYP